MKTCQGPIGGIIRIILPVSYLKTTVRFGKYSCGYLFTFVEQFFVRMKLFTSVQAFTVRAGGGDVFLG